MAATDAMGFWKIAEADPGHLAVVDPVADEMTYGELAALSNRVVRGLRALGLERGDQVTTVLPNGFEQVAVALAAFQSGFYYTPVNWHLVGPEIAYIVNDSESKVLIVARALRRRGGPCLGRDRSQPGRLLLGRCGRAVSGRSPS